MKDSDIKDMAKKRVEFRDHLLVYIVVNVVLFGINMWSSPGTWWFLFVVVFWGIGLVFHWRDAYFGAEASRVDREYQKLKKEAKGK